MTPISRRALLSLAGSLAAWSFCELAISRCAMASTVSPILVAWLRDVDELARSLRGETLSQALWREQMAALYRRVPFADLLALVDIDALVRRAPLPSRGEAFDELVFPNVEGLPPRPAFYRVVAGFRAGRSIPPHAHNHLVSSFLVLRGQLRGRHFDRVRDDGDEIWTTPTGDRTFVAGDSSTVSQERDNIHWFTAERDRSFVLDLGVGGLSASGTVGPLGGQDPNKTNRIYLALDPRASEGATKARRLSEVDAYRRYG